MSGASGNQLVPSASAGEVAQDLTTQGMTAQSLSSQDRTAPGQDPTARRVTSRGQVGQVPQSATSQSQAPQDPTVQSPNSQEDGSQGAPAFGPLERIAPGDEGRPGGSHQDRVVIVTGGTRSIGAVIAARFLREGARVLVCGRNEPEELPSGGGRTAEFVSCDVRDFHQAQELVATAVERFGRLDVLVNNAGGSPEVAAETASPRLSTKIVELNLLAPLFTAQAAYAVMKGQPEGGQIINIGSVASRDPSPGTAIYAAAKAGLNTLTRALGQEFAPLVRVNQVTVGLVQTELAHLYYGDEHGQERVAGVIPMARMARPEDIAGACMLLTSTDAAYLNGSEILVDGGGELPARVAVLRD